MFGETLRIERDNRWGITLKAPTQKEAAKLAPSFNEPVIGYTTHMGFAVTAKDEEEWWERVRKDKWSVVWGIYADDLKTDDKTIKGGMIGVTSLHLNEASSRAVSTGIVIAKKEFWGNGIAGLAHIGRTWYAATVLDSELILSYVMGGSEVVNYKGSFARWKKTQDLDEGNWASRKALERVGYTCITTEPGYMKRLGKRHAIWRFQWIHPDKTQDVFPHGMPKRYESGVELAKTTLDLSKTMIKNI